VLALTIKTKKESAPELVTLVPLLLPFKEVKGLNVKMLCSLFLFRGKVPRAQEEDSKSNKSTSLEDDLVACSPQKRRAEKAFRKSLRKKLKIGPAEPLASSRANRQKGKAVVIAKADGEVIVRKARLKQKIKCLCYSKMPAKLIKALNSKELENSIFFILH